MNNIDNKYLQDGISLVLMEILRMDIKPSFRFFPKSVVTIIISNSHI
jgi:hypothetical protein